MTIRNVFITCLIERKFQKIREMSDNITKPTGDGAPPRIVYIYDNLLSECTDKIPNILGRGDMVHELIRAYRLVSRMECQPSVPASKEDLLQFHSQDYVNFLFHVGMKSDEDDSDDNDSSNCNYLVSNFGISVSGNSSHAEENLDEFGLGYDCPVFKNLGEFSLRIAGGTITAARALNNGADIAINWFGGWHHAQRLVLRKYF